jgi:CW-type Zinc Finger
MPPKVARRKKLVKEQLSQSESFTSRKVDGGDDDDDDDEDDVEQEKPPSSSSRASKSSSSSSSAVAESNSIAAAAAAVPEDDRVWVQCNTCDKWRALPNTVDPAALPDIWFCELNIYDDNRNCCEVSYSYDNMLLTFNALCPRT